MATGNEWWAEMKMAIENGEDVEKMFQLYVYNHMKKKNLHEAAEIFVQEANLEQSQLARCEESLLTEWWQIFWPTFCSRLSNKAGANVQSSGQQSMVNAVTMLASLKNQGASSSRQTPNDPQHDVLPVIASTGMSQQLSTPGIYQRRTGKLPMDTINDSVLGQSAAEPLLVAGAFGNERLPPVGSQSHLQLPPTGETPAQVTEDPKDYGLGWFDEMELTRPVGPNSTSTIVADHAGEVNWNNQLPLTGLGVVPGPDLLSYESRVTDAFLPFMRQVMHEAYSRFGSSGQPPEQSSGREFGSERNQP